MSSMKLSQKSKKEIITKDEIKKIITKDEIKEIITKDENTNNETTNNGFILKALFQM